MERVLEKKASLDGSDLCFQLQPCSCPRVTSHLTFIPEKGRGSPVRYSPAWDYHTSCPHCPSRPHHRFGLSQQPPHCLPASALAVPALLLSVHCLQSDPLQTEVRSCHPPASSARLPLALRTQAGPEHGPQSPARSGPSRLPVSSLRPAPDTSPPLLRHVSVSEPLCLLSLWLEGSTSRPFYGFLPLFLRFV